MFILHFLSPRRCGVDLGGEAGYRTAAFGKVAPLASPLEQGFEVFVGQVDQALCHNMYPKKIDSG